jgi:CRP-like cAMP-binding protein
MLTMVTFDHLEGLTFCKGMSREYLDLLIAAGEVRTFPTGSYLFHEGQHSASIYLLYQGEVGLEVSLPDTGPVRLQTAGPGELLGWSPLLGLGWMTASAVALTPCWALALDVRKVLSLADEQPRFGMELMRRLAMTLARRLNDTRMQILEEHRNEGQAVS